MVYGSAAVWAAQFHKIYEQVLQIFPSAWAACTAHFAGRYVAEQTVTNKLVLCLRKEQQVQLGPVGWYVQPSYTLLTELLSGDPTTKGIIDFVVKFGHTERIYFAFECKWLNVVRRSRRCSQVAPYIEQGLMRYVKAKYAEDLPRAAVIGYVFDADTAFCLSRLTRRISRGATKAQLTAVRNLSPLLLGAKTIVRFESEHHRPLAPIVVEHLLCPYQ